MAQKNTTNCKNCFYNKSSVFNVLTEDEKELLVQNHECVSYQKGEVIYHEGEAPKGLICLSKGKAKIFKQGIGGRDLIVRLSNPMGFIGYRALFAGHNYISSAMAIEESIACIIDKKTTFEVLESNSKFGIEIIHYMAKELGRSNTQTVNLTQKHIRGRLAESLLFLRDTYGIDKTNGTIKIYLSREDIANLSNMTTSNAIRTLTAFSEEEIMHYASGIKNMFNESIVETA